MAFLAGDDYSIADIATSRGSVATRRHLGRTLRTIHMCSDGSMRSRATGRHPGIKAVIRKRAALEFLPMLHLMIYFSEIGNCLSARRNLC